MVERFEAKGSPRDMIATKRLKEIQKKVKNSNIALNINDADYPFLVLFLSDKFYKQPPVQYALQRKFRDTTQSKKPSTSVSA